MSEANTMPPSLAGLSEKQVLEARKKYGLNALRKEEKSGFLHVLGQIATEPMFLLLVAASGLYFILGEYSDGFIMLAAIGFVSGISLYQETRSRNALQALKKLTQPNS